MLQELLEFINQNGLNWFNFSGAIIAYILVGLKIYEFRKKRVSLNIKLEGNFYSTISQSYEDETIININGDLRNTGLEPTTLVGANLYSDNELLSNLKMTIVVYNNTGMRIEPNDRKIIKLYASKNVLLPNDIKELKAKLIFNFAHKDISKKMKLIRDVS